MRLNFKKLLKQMKLLKNPPFEIDPKDPFKSDELGRKPAIELLTTLIQSTEQPFVMSVEAPWGWGKTKFVEMWKAHLENNQHACLHFNAWENDFVSDPLVAFVGEMKSIVQTASGGTNPNSPVRKSLARLQKLGGALTKKGAPIIVKAVATKLLGAEAVKDASEVLAASAEDVADFLSETAKKQIEHYEEEKSSIRGFRETLKELAAKVTELEGKPKQIVFFVDELDRCRPDFAMTLLERIKHLFNVERVVFVLSVDREQLRNTVRHLYGSGEHADVYLRRFIDLTYQLPKPTRRAFADMLYRRFQMDDFFRTRDNGNTERERFLPAFVATTNWLNLDLRTQEQCFTRINVIARLWHPKSFLPTDALCVLVALKVGRPELFDALWAKKTPPREHVPKMTFEFEEFPERVEATLIAMFGEEQDVQREIDALRQKTAENEPAFSARGLKVRLYEHLAQHRRQLRRLIEFSTDVN